MSTHDLLLLSFADLTSHGIRAQPELTKAVPEARAEALRDIKRLFSNAVGSYVFWTKADAAVFDDDGNLPRGTSLPLYHSGPNVAPAVKSICERFGLAVDGPDDGDTLYARSHND